jgi:alpha/beta superfamily hydrolase
MKTEKVSFMSEGMKISGILHLPERENPPCVITSHGLLSSKNSEKYIALGEQISSEGMAVLRFDFRGIGESEGREEDKILSELGKSDRVARVEPRRFSLLDEGLDG